MKQLEGRTAVITGAASGIGLATASRLAREGMNVVLADIETGPLAAAVAKLEAEGLAVLGVPTDVASWDAVEALAEQTVEHFGAVHVLHNNAGVVVGGPIEKLSLEDWKWVIDVNLWSVIYGIKAFLPRIKEAGEGHVISTASTAGLVSAPIIGPYNATKFGVVALQETLQRELEAEDSPIRASVLCPGAIATQIADAARNRPGDSAKAHVTSKQEARFIDGARSMLAAQGKDPAEVADLVVTAIREQQFWILTHPEWNDILRHRVDALATEGRLTHGFGG
jgi:NAD(P)-dependent dehydrogenase (short-subunit alcohol dehydrogenase family)